MFRVCPSYFCEGRGHFVGTTGEDSCWGSDPEMFPRHSLISLGFAPFTIRVQQDVQFCLNHRSAKEYRRNHKSAHFLRSQQSIIFLGLIKVDGKLLDVTAFPKMIDHHGFFLNRHCKLDQRALKTSPGGRVLSRTFRPTCCGRRARTSVRGGRFSSPVTFLAILKVLDGLIMFNYSLLFIIFITALEIWTIFGGANSMNLNYRPLPLESSYLVYSAKMNCYK